MIEIVYGRKNLRIIHLCYSDDKGGAAIGARRLHQAMLSQGINSFLVVVEKHTDDPQVIQLPDRPYRRRIAAFVERLSRKLYFSENKVIRNLNIIPMRTAKFLNAMEGDIIQMHWVGANTISIQEISTLNKPVVWKLPDMWGFSGAEHYNNVNDPSRYLFGYTPTSRPLHESGLDIDRLIWNIKYRSWSKTDFSIVAPSSWLAGCAKSSLLFGNRRIRHILNPIDVNMYAPSSTIIARNSFNLPLERNLLMFGAMHATQDRRKGFHHLKNALTNLRKYLSPENTDLVILGSSGGAGQTLSGFKVHYLGTISDEQRIVDAYNAVDVCILPTEKDNLPNIIKEATCCGVPCVGFNIGGMPDMIDHMETGYLATPYDALDLARGIAWVVNNVTCDMKVEVRKRAVKKHDPVNIVNQYLEFYDEILNDYSKKTVHITERETVCAE